jgi:hypothetical protein
MTNDYLNNNNSYISFDATSIRDLIVNRLNQSQIFTDQNYQGSNMSAFLDVIGFSFSTLLYYLNKTSSETLYSETQIYENINRLVKILNYNPIGRIGQNVPFKLTVRENLNVGNYVIPRFSYLSVGGTNFSFNRDIQIYKPTVGNVLIDEVSNKYLLYQGLFQEYPTYTAIGIENEVMYLSFLESVYIDHFNIYVFVKEKSNGRWQEWERVPETFLYGSNENVYQIRFNENKRYEIKFGDDINGKKLKEGDEVAVYFLNVDPESSNIGPNSIGKSKIVQYNSIRFEQIYNDIKNNILGEILTSENLQYLTLDNDYPSTFYTDEESVDSIRSNAAKNFRSQYRLVTSLDYETYIKTNYSNLLADVKVLNNEDYLRTHIKYLYNIGLNQPQKDDKILLNQIKFADSCNFNNLYVYTVPKSELQNYLAPSQKEVIINGLQNSKTLTSEIVPMDPVYIYIDFYVNSPFTSPSPNDLAENYLVITKTPNSRRANSAILSDIENLIKQSFNRKTNKLGELIDIYQLSTSILNIESVDRVQTYRADIDAYTEGVSLLLWNYYYPLADSQVYTQNIELEFFQYPIFNNIENISSRIKINEPTGTIKVADF